jgi:hypothetical protein
MLLAQIEGDLGCSKFFLSHGDFLTFGEFSSEHAETGISYRFETCARPGLRTSSDPCRAQASASYQRSWPPGAA